MTIKDKIGDRSLSTPVKKLRFILWSIVMFLAWIVVAQQAVQFNASFYKPVTFHYVK